MTNTNDASDDEAFESDENEDVGLIPTSKAAEMLGVSEATILRRAKELKARKGPRGRLLFEVERLRLAREEGGVTKKPTFVGASEGTRDAKVIAGFEAGRSIAQIVMQEQVPLRSVLELRDAWLESHRADRAGVEFACTCGAAANLHTAKCTRCADRARSLSDAERQLLAGAALAPNEASCSCCGKSRAIEMLDRICIACRRENLVAAVLGGRLLISMRTSHGIVPLHTLSAEESHTIGLALAPRPAAVPVEVAPVRPPPETPPNVDVRAELKRMREGMGIE
jgi:hypothetical protein